MAAATVSVNVGPRDGSMKQISWALTTADPSGDSFQFSDFADRTWQAKASAWGGATLGFEGSYNGTDWFPLSNLASGAAAALTGDGGLTTIEVPQFCRPRLTTPGTSASVAVSVIMRRAPK